MDSQEVYCHTKNKIVLKMDGLSGNCKPRLLQDQPRLPCAVNFNQNRAERTKKRATMSIYIFIIIFVIIVVFTQTLFLDRLANKYPKYFKSQIKSVLLYPQAYIPRDAVWQPVTGVEEKFYVYSAYIERMNHSVIRILAVTKTEGPPPVLCRIWLSNNKSFITAATVQAIRENWNLTYSAAYVLCNLSYVNLKANDVINARVSVISATHPADLYSNLLTVLDTKPNANITAHVHACVKPFSDSNGRPNLLNEWLDMNHSWGMSHFYLYNKSVTHNVSCLLNYYNGQGLIILLPWQLLIRTQWKGENEFNTRIMKCKRVNISKLSKNQYLVISGILFLLCCLYETVKSDKTLAIKISRCLKKTLLETVRKIVIQHKIEENLENSLQLDKGMGCDFPKLNPFAKETSRYGENVTKVDCRNISGIDWVMCNMSKCKITKYVLDHYKDIKCKYRDVIYESDQKYFLSEPVTVGKSESYEYTLKKSDHVKVDCNGFKNGKNNLTTWNGHAIGFREVVPKPPPPNRKDTINIMIFGFDSASKNGFIRLMPKSFKMLNETMKAHIFNGYSTVGDGTPACLFPLLTGKTELELPDVRKSITNTDTVDSMPWIWYKLKDDGYRTAFFEDKPNIGTFQYRFNGFGAQPTDHYLRPFLISADPVKQCVGERSTHKLMMDITKDFHTLPGKKFSFTWVVGVSHDNFNKITLADDEFTEFLSSYSNGSLYDNTLLIVMADHGPRYGNKYQNFRNTMLGKLEERMPFLSIILPRKLKETRPDLDEALSQNEQVIVTAHDLHATILDAIDLREHWNPFKIKRANLTRGLTLFEPIPTSRSCSEAGIEPHWCPCLKWENGTVSDKLNQKVAESFVKYINKLTERFRDLCVPRELLSIEYVQKQKFHKKLETFSKAKDSDGYIGHFDAGTKYSMQNYQIKVIVGPNNSTFEASAVYNTRTKQFNFNLGSISRINEYGSESKCIAKSDTNLLKFCYCKTT